MNKFDAAIGPLFTNWGWKNHSLLLRDSELVDVPYSRTATWRLGASWHLPFFSDPGHKLRSDAVSQGLPNDELTRATRYPVRSIREIRLECRATYHTIVLRSIDDEEIRFRFINRRQIVDAREALQRLYPTVYQETGFPTSTIMKILKH